MFYFNGVSRIRTDIILASKASAMTKLGDNPSSFRMTGTLAPNAQAVPSVRTITNFAGQLKKMCESRHRRRATHRIGTSNEFVILTCCHSLQLRVTSQRKYFKFTAIGNQTRTPYRRRRYRT